jgi:hypothetical protein
LGSCITGGLEFPESSRGNAFRGNGSSLPDLTSLIELISSQVGGGLEPLVLGLRVHGVEESDDVGGGFLGDSSVDSGLSGGVSETPGTIVGDEGSEILLLLFGSGLGITDSLGKVGDVIGGLAGGDGTGGGISLESVEDLAEVTLEGVLELVSVWGSLGLGLRGSEHQWDCDVLKHFAK